MQRSFDIYNAGDVLHRGFSPSRLQASSLYNSGQFLYNGDAVYTLNKTRGSSLPPLINAFEVYSLLRKENFTTDSEDDVKTPNILLDKNLEPDATVYDDCFYSGGAYYYVQTADDDQE
ncbi:hypothetical protein VPH35_045882 [Triticum aestivum]